MGDSTYSCPLCKFDKEIPYLVMVCYPLNGDPELLSGKPAAECPLGGQGCAPAQFPIMAAQHNVLIQ
jgi:hypothetical protein